jgi:hypothetical protein
MKIKKVVFSTTDMNVTSNFVKKDAFIDFSATGQGVSILNVDVIRRYPINVMVTNTSGQDVEIAFIGLNEEDDFTSTPDNYFFLLKSTASITTTSTFPRIYKVSVRKISSNTSSELRLDFYNHQGTLKIN